MIVPERVPADAVVYCDPPYLLSERRSVRQYYRHELVSEADHMRFLGWARRLPCRVLISGYASELYASRIPGWRVEQFSAQTRGGGTAIETVWCNFPEPTELHDTRFVGMDSGIASASSERSHAGCVARRDSLSPSAR